MPQTIGLAIPMRAAYSSELLMEGRFLQGVDCRWGRLSRSWSRRDFIGR